MRVLHVQYTNPGAYPPLMRGAQLLAEAGAKVLMLGTRVEGLDALDGSPSHNLDIRMMPVAANGWRLKAHYARYAAWVARDGAAWKPHWVYASDLYSAPIAIALGALTGARIAYHEHDAPSTAHARWTIKQCMAARRRLLHQADLVITPNAARSAHLSELGGGRAVLTAWNCPRRPLGDAPEHRPSDELRVLYRGSINGERLPATVIDAVARAGRPVSLTVAGYETAGSRGHVASLEAHAATLGIRDRIRPIGTVAETELAALGPESDVGLAFMPMDSADENMRHMTGASNKVFEYLSMGVVPLVSELPDWQAAFVEPGYALACDPRDPDAIAATFGWAASHRDQLWAMAERGWSRLQDDWNYETQFAPVLRAMLGGARATRRRAVASGTEPSCAF